MNIFKFLKKHLRKHIKICGIDNQYNSKILIDNQIRLDIIGNNNKIIIGNNCCLPNCKIQIIGDDNIIEIGNNVCSYNLNIYFGFENHNKLVRAALKIGENTTGNGLSIFALEPGTQIDIGKNCLLSDRIEIWASDTHSIIDESGKLLNYGGNVQIGDNVWIARDVKIGKRAKISNNSIVGFNSVVTSNFSQSNIVIAGNPAKIIKQNIDWKRLSPDEYLHNVQNL